MAWSTWLKHVCSHSFDFDETILYGLNCSNKTFWRRFTTILALASLVVNIMGVFFFSSYSTSKQFESHISSMQKGKSTPASSTILPFTQSTMFGGSGKSSLITNSKRKQLLRDFFFEAICYLAIILTGLLINVLVSSMFLASQSTSLTLSQSTGSNNMDAYVTIVTSIALIYLVLPNISQGVL